MKRNFLKALIRIGGTLALITLICHYVQGQGKATCLKDAYKDYFPIGVAVSGFELRGESMELIKKEFNGISPGNALKMGPIHPAEEKYNWEPGDKIVDFAQANNMKVHGHVLCWHSQAPAWIFTDSKGDTVSKEVLMDRLKKHIFEVAGRYKGKIYAWDVVNEAIADEPNLYLRNTAWSKICGEDFIFKAFEWAHEADPTALLYYNDYNTEIPQKRDRIYKLLKTMIDKHISINGIGLQGHWSIYEPSEKNLRDAIEKYTSLGLDIMITELDVSIYPPEGNPRDLKPGEILAFSPEIEKKQADSYKMFFRIFREYKKNIKGVTFWGVSDKVSWLNFFPVRGRTNYPLLFDREMKPKAVYYDLINF